MSRDFTPEERAHIRKMSRQLTVEGWRHGHLYVTFRLWWAELVYTTTLANASRWRLWRISVWRRLALLAKRRLPREVNIPEEWLDDVREESA